MIFMLKMITQDTTVTLDIVNLLQAYRIKVSGKRRGRGVAVKND